MMSASRKGAGWHFQLGGKHETGQQCKSKVRESSLREEPRGMRNGMSENKPAFTIASAGLEYKDSQRWSLHLGPRQVITLLRECPVYMVGQGPRRSLSTASPASGTD